MSDCDSGSGQPLPISLSGKRVLITGAAGGIGTAAARACRNLGASLVLVDIVKDGALREHYGALGLDGTCHQCNTADRQAVSTLSSNVGRIDALIDAAGLLGTEDWNDPDWDTAFDRVLGANLRGPINLARSFVPIMKQNGGGRIVYCGSVAGFTGGLRGGPHYAASKGGLHAFLRWLAQHVIKDNILVNAVAPGATDTGMIQGLGYDPEYYPQGRFAKPEEIGATLAFLCTGAAGFMSGSIIDINGGTHFR